jgi:CRISPR-associated protein Csh2
MRRGVTWYDSASKAGSENEMLIWVQLRENSKIVLPNFTTLINWEDKSTDEKYVYDFEKLAAELNQFNNEIQSIEIYYNKQTCSLKHIPTGTIENNLKYGKKSKINII